MKCFYWLRLMSMNFNFENNCIVFEIAKHEMFVKPFLENIY